MYRKRNYSFFYFIILGLLLVGCTVETADSEDNTISETETEVENQAYVIALEKGLDELDGGNLEKAAAYFEIALEEIPDDDQAAILLKQTNFYIEAVDSLQEKAYESAQVKAEAVKTFENGSDLLIQRADAILKEISDIEAEKQAEAEKLDEFKGIFVEFKGEPYQSLVGYMSVITEEKNISALESSGVIYNDIISRSFDGKTLKLNIHTPEQAGYGEVYYDLELSTSIDENGYTYLIYGEETILYPITVEDMNSTGLELHDPTGVLLQELKEYDKKVPRSTNFLGEYSETQIEYAQVWLNVMDNPRVREISVYFFKKGEPVLPGYEESHQLYPEDITVLSGYYGSDGVVAYSNNGDGSINIYNIPTRLHSPPEKYPELIEEAVTPKLFYLENRDDEVVMQLIDRIHLLNY